MMKLSANWNMWPDFVITLPVRVALDFSKFYGVPGNIQINPMVYKKCATVLYHCYSCFFLFFFVLFLIIIIILFFAPPAPFVGYINWTCHYVTDKELINLPWFLAPFAPDWMFAVSWLNPQHLFPTRTLPRSHAHFWNPTLDLTSWLGSSNWLWNVLLVCVSVFHLLVSGCNKEVIYLISLIPIYHAMEKTVWQAWKNIGVCD